MEEYEQHSRRQTDSRLRKFWHDWMPIITLCASGLGCFAGSVYGVTTWKLTMERDLKDLKTGQSALKEGQESQEKRLSNIEIEHHIMVGKINKVMFRLRIPLDDVYPDYHTYPDTERKGPDAALDKELNELYKNNGHSQATPTEPVLGSMQAPPPPQLSRKEW